MSDPVTFILESPRAAYITKRPKDDCNVEFIIPQASRVYWSCRQVFGNENNLILQTGENALK